MNHFNSTLSSQAEFAACEALPSKTVNHVTYFKPCVTLARAE